MPHDALDQPPADPNEPHDREEPEQPVGLAIRITKLTENRMLGRIVVLGTPMHVDIIRVVMEDGLLVAADRADDQDLYLAMVLAGAADGPFQTTEIPGFEGRWVLIATPHSR